MSILGQLQARAFRWVSRRVGRDTPSYVYHPSHTVVNDYAEYSGIPVRVIADLINQNTELNSLAWRALRGTGTWEAAAMRFYGEAESYVYDLLSVNYSRRAVMEKLNRFNPGIIRGVADHNGKDFLEFGGGLGLFCEAAYTWGKRATYLDLPGPVMDFAAWRFRKYRCPIEILSSCPKELRLWQDFDIIFTDAVFEHLIDPEQVLNELLAHLNPGGLLVLLVDLGNDPARPMHRPIDIHSLHDQIRKAGCWNVFGHGTFASAWARPRRDANMATTVLTKAEADAYFQAVNLRLDRPADRDDRVITCTICGDSRTLPAGPNCTIRALRLLLPCEQHRKGESPGRFGK